MAILTPIVLMTGVGVLFTSAIGVVPVSGWIRAEYFHIVGPIGVALLALAAAPLVWALITRLRRRLTLKSVIQVVTIVFAIVTAAAVIYLTLQPGRPLALMARKDVVIYIVGGLTWYLPSFAIAAGVWRRFV